MNQITNLIGRKARITDGDLVGNIGEIVGYSLEASLLVILLDRSGKLVRVQETDVTILK
jgi:hypothetical protein